MHIFLQKSVFRIFKTTVKRKMLQLYNKTVCVSFQNAVNCNGDMHIHGNKLVII